MTINIDEILEAEIEDFDDAGQDFDDDEGEIDGDCNESHPQS